MDEMILNSIYAIVGIALLISWVFVVIQIYKIKNKLYEKSCDESTQLKDEPKQYDKKAPDRSEELETLKAMYENGAYTTEEYEEERQLILNRN